MMLKKLNLSLFAGIFLMSFTQMAKAQSAVLDDFVSHKAFYEMELAEASSGSDVTYLKGAMGYKWQDACESWIVDQTLALQLSLRNSEQFNRLTNFSAWEAKETEEFRFNYRELVNGQEVESFAGRAELQEEGLIASFNLPNGAEQFPLPAQTYFPTKHMEKIIKAALANEKVEMLYLFDGSDVKGAVETSVFILPSAKSEPLIGDSRAYGNSRWMITASFYDVEKKEAEPDYEIRFLVTETGVIEEMLMDYGDYKVKAHLKELELFDDFGCE